MFLCNFFHYFVVECCNNGSSCELCSTNVVDGDDKNIIMKTISISTSTSTIGSRNNNNNSINVNQQEESLSSLKTNEMKELQQQTQKNVIGRENVENYASGSKQILSRKRRYLSFPSGSSFQIGGFFFLIEFVVCINLFLYELDVEGRFMKNDVKMMRFRYVNRVIKMITLQRSIG